MSSKYPENITDAKKHEYCFWQNKPVLNFDEISGTSEQLENLLERKVYSSDVPVQIPDMFKWTEIDISNDNQMQQVVDFLYEHYLVDVTGKFKLNYTVQFLRWALGKNGLMIALVSQKTNSLYGVVGASRKQMTIFDKNNQNVAAVDFLCAHPKCRGKKIAFVLIDEIVRRLVLSGYTIGCFTTSRCVPSPTTVIRYYHRPLNYSKLFDLQFTRLQNGNPETIKKFNKLFTVVSNNDSRYVQMTKEHVPEVLKLYNEWNAKFNIYVEYDETSFAEYFLNTDVVRSYVINDTNGKPIDFVSLYLLPYNVIGREEKIYASYLLSYTSNTESTDQMLKNIVKISANMAMDVLIATDIMTIGESLLTHDREITVDSDTDDKNKMYEHKFIKSSGKLYFNFFNWKCPRIKPRQINWVTP